MIQKRLIGIGVVVLIGLLLVGMLVLSSLIAYVNTLVQDTAPQLEVWLNLADQGLMYLLMPLVFSALFWFFPAAEVNFRDVWPAGILTAFLIGASRYLVAFYLQFSSTSEVYGAAGSLVVY
jgi:membrane protein